MTPKQLDKELKRRGFKVLTRTQLVNICKMTCVDYSQFQDEVIRPKRGVRIDEL